MLLSLALSSLSAVITQCCRQSKLLSVDSVVARGVLLQPIMLVMLLWTELGRIMPAVAMPHTNLGHHALLIVSVPRLTGELAHHEAKKHYDDQIYI
jgi:hypothetical protein